jgi:hypothetical protein
MSMDGWQITLIIVGLAMAACALSELRYRAAHRKMKRVLRTGPKTGLELVQQHGFRRGSVYVLLLRMEDEGLVEREYYAEGKGDKHRYRLREKP